ncbi:hypothetical protein V6Z12_A02G154300 [Gossypium hirsutum]
MVFLVNTSFIYSSLCFRNVFFQQPQSLSTEDGCYHRVSVWQSSSLLSLNSASSPRILEFRASTSDSKSITCTCKPWFSSFRVFT